jgi:hypothetical protein
MLALALNGLFLGVAKSEQRRTHSSPAVCTKKLRFGRTGDGSPREMMRPICWTGREIQLLKEAIPQTKRIGVLWRARRVRPAFSSHDQRQRCRPIARDWPRLVHFPVGSPADFGPAFKRMVEEKCAARRIWVKWTGRSIFEDGGRDPRRPVDPKPG